MEGSGNFHIGKTEIPLGLAAISAVAVHNRCRQPVYQIRSDHRGGDFSALSSLGYSRFPNGTWPGSVTGNRSNSISSSCTGIRSWEAGRWACGPAMSWSRFVIPGTCTICELSAQHGIREAERGGDERPAHHRDILQRQHCLLEASQIFDHYERSCSRAVVLKFAEKEGKARYRCWWCRARMYSRPSWSRTEAGIPDGSSAVVRTTHSDEQGKMKRRCMGSACPSRDLADADGFRADGSLHEYLLGPPHSSHARRTSDSLHSVWARYHETILALAGAHHYHVVAFGTEQLQQERKGGSRKELLDRRGNKRFTGRGRACHLRPQTITSLHYLSHTCYPGVLTFIGNPRSRNGVTGVTAPVISIHSVIIPARDELRVHAGRSAGCMWTPVTLPTAGIPMNVSTPDSRFVREIVKASYSLLSIGGRFPSSVPVNLLFQPIQQFLREPPF